MKRIILAFILITTTSLTLTSHAQLGFKPFRHFSVGVDVGTTGVGFEVATTLHSMVNLRGGFSFLPFSYTTDFDVDVDTHDLYNLYDQHSTLLNNNGVTRQDINNLSTNVDLEAKSGLYNGKILVDFHPIPNKGFHITAGLYFGRERIVTVEGSLPMETINTLDKVNNVLERNPNLGYEPFSTGVVLGDYTIEADENGKIDAGIKIQKVKPYVGIGFGRAVPKKRVGVQFDMGCMFHGKPSVTSKNADVRDLLNDELDSSGFVDVMNKITVYPVISLKITGRIL